MRQQDTMTSVGRLTVGMWKANCQAKPLFVCRQ